MEFRRVLFRSHADSLSRALELALLVLQSGVNLSSRRCRSTISAVSSTPSSKLGRVEGRRMVPEVSMEMDRSRSEEHTSELQSLMRISYAVFCLIKKTDYGSTQACDPNATVHRRVLWPYRCPAIHDTQAARLRDQTIGQYNV